MASLNAVYVSIDMCSSSLDRLMKKSDIVANKLLIASAYAGAAASKILSASATTEKAVSKMLNAGAATDAVVSKMLKASTSTDNVVNKMIKASASTGKVADKMITASSSAEKVSKKMLTASTSATDMNNKVKATGDGADKASTGVGKLIKSFASLKNIQKGMKLVDDYTNAGTKLGLITNGLTEQEQLQDKVFAAANRSRGSYSQIANAVTDLKVSTGSLFSNNDEALGFTELTQKALVASGASPAERTSGMKQVTDAMTSGTLKVDDLSSLEKSAPLIYQAIAKYTKKSGSELNALASEGSITSEDIKNAMFGMSDEINNQFESTPMIFADIWNRIKDGALEALAPIMDAVSKLISSDEFNGVINGIVEGFNIISNVVDSLIKFVITNWAVIEPILMAIGLYLAYIGTVALIGLMKGLFGVIVMEFAAIAPIIIIIATIATVIFMLQSLGVTFEDIFAFIGGVVGTAIALIMNIFINLWNFVADFINFFGNAFSHPLLAIQIMFSEWSMNILGFILNIAQGIEDLINHIPGGEDVDITSGLIGIKDKLEADISILKTEADWKEYAKKADLVDQSEAANTGIGIGKDVYSEGNKFIKYLTGDDSKKDSNQYDPNQNPPAQYLPPDKPIAVEGTGSNGAVQVDDMSDEDLQYLRDLAERDYVAKIATNTLAPNISVNFTGPISKEVDTKAMYSRISKILTAEIATASEGVY